MLKLRGKCQRYLFLTGDPVQARSQGRVRGVWSSQNF